MSAPELPPEFQRNRNLAIGGLALFALFVWLRNRSWILSAEETLPVFVAVPLYAWLGRPWHWRSTYGKLSSLVVAAGFLLALAGIVLDLTLLLAAAWCVSLCLFLAVFTEGAPRRLILLPFLGFPWITLDGQAIGWWFRFSGAAAAELIYTCMGYHVQREGTFLLVQDMPLSIEPGCAGMNVLQATLIAGFALIFIKVPAGFRFWIAVALLVPLAWLSNTIRIVMLGMAGLFMGANFAMGWFHQVGGWLVLCMMFLLCQGLFRLIASEGRRTA